VKDDMDGNATTRRELDRIAQKVEEDLSIFYQ
jgi:hypothetical protein